jgi:hypothetical protein
LACSGQPTEEQLQDLPKQGYKVLILDYSINRKPLRGNFLLVRNYKLAPAEPPVYRK